MGEATAKVIGGAIAGQTGEHLGLSGQTAKGARMQHAGAIAREGGAIGVGRLRVGALRQRTALLDRHAGQS